MKILKKTGLLLAILLAIVCSFFIYLNYLASASDYPEDSFFENEKNKKALIIVAHDDDAVSMAGTISKLTADGWEIRQMCFYQGWKNKDSIRKKDFEKVAKIMGLKSSEYHDFKLRKDRDKIKKPYMPISYEQIDSLYEKVAIENYIHTFVERYKPSAIFTLDEIVGGYGHPDHVLIGKLISDYCRKHKDETTFSIKTIYQAVFDPAMNEKILKNMEVFKKAKEVYDVERTPSPNVQISFEGFEQNKKRAMLAYSTEQNTLTKIWPYYDYLPASIYFGIFSKEYYRLLKKENNYQ